MSYEFVLSEEFYEILYRNSNFCDGIGKVMLSAGRLETNIRSFLKAKKIKGVCARSNLGELVRKHNYFAHSLYDLFSAEIAETILPRSGLTEMDAEIFVDRVHILADDFSHFAKLVYEADIKKDKVL